MSSVDASTGTRPVDGGAAVPSHITGGDFIGAPGTPAGSIVSVQGVQGGYPIITNAFNPTPVVAYRAGITANDVMSPPAAGTLSAVAGGSLAATTYNVKVLGLNAFGRTTGTSFGSQVTVLNDAVRVAIPQLATATGYDIYMSTDADPKWVARITEAQRAAGAVVTAVGTVGAGSVAGSVDVRVPGTGLQSATTAAMSTAYVIPAETINATNYGQIDVFFHYTRNGDTIAAAGQLLMFAKDIVGNKWYQVPGSSSTLTPAGGTSVTFNALYQRVSLSTRGWPMIALLMNNLVGLGASIDLLYSLS